jgi:hypothetical protein
MVEKLKCVQESDECTGKVEWHASIAGTGAVSPRCEGHYNKLLDFKEKVQRDYPDSPTPPSWYKGDDYAGEHWNDDY